MCYAKLAAAAGAMPHLVRLAGDTRSEAAVQAVAQLCYTHVWPCDHVLYPYMVMWPCVTPIYGHMTMCHGRLLHNFARSQVCILL